jgi:hypothetical protein
LVVLLVSVVACAAPPVNTGVVVTVENLDGPVVSVVVHDRTVATLDCGEPPFVMDATTLGPLPTILRFVTSDETEFGRPVDITGDESLEVLVRSDGVVSGTAGGARGPAPLGFCQPHT